MTLVEYNHSVYEYADRVYRFILKNIRDQEQASDIVQDTYEKLWLKHESVSFLKVRSYLFTTAHHTLIDWLRKNHRIKEWTPEMENRQILEQPTYDLKETLDWALSKIPDIQRSIILLRDYEGYTYEEIGNITQLSESQVKVYIFRGRMALRKLIGNPEVLI